jgi:asparagine synthetase B (glutamine-hydrolysing)
MTIKHVHFHSHFQILRLPRFLPRRHCDLLNKKPYGNRAMCGIFCSISRSQHVHADEQVLALLQRRGPDSTGHVQQIYCERHEKLSPEQGNDTTAYLNFTSTVLSLRGSKTVSQPLQDEDQSHVLCWNGEAWTIAGHPTEGNDTKAIFDLLSGAAAKSRSMALNNQDAANNIAEHMASVSGPYSFVFHDRLSGRVYLGRDFLGRRSLLWRANKAGDLLISSVTSGSVDGAWTEIEADGIYCIDLSASSEPPAGSHGVFQPSSSFAVTKVPYNVNTDGSTSDTPSVGTQSDP